MFMGVVCACHIERSEDNVQGSAFSFQKVDLRDPSQAVGITNRTLRLLFGLALPIRSCFLQFSLQDTGPEFSPSGLIIRIPCNLTALSKIPI